MATLETIAESMAETARIANVSIVAGDTKVAAKGQVDGVFITTAGIGRINGNCQLSGANAKQGDAIIVTGDIGRHGTTILLEREQFGIEAKVTSDCAPLWPLVKGALSVTNEIHTIRDATRGGVGSVLYEIAAQSGVTIHLYANAIPVEREVRGVCDLLGLDPIYLACEGRLVMVVPENYCESVLTVLRKLPHGEGATVIGHVGEESKTGAVVVETPLGATTMLPRPTGELLPRIC